MNRFRYCYSVALIALLAACTPSQPPPEPAAQLKAVALDNTVKIVAGQTVYVPIYSQIYMWEKRRTINLTATLSIRNTDLTHPIIIVSTNYYNDAGKRIRTHLEKPVELPPLASTSFVIDQEDITGGSGAAFVVEWIAQHQVSAPAIESVMINTSGNQGISFVSPGRVIKQRRSGQ